MAEHSAIEWTDATWNPITGCSVISPGCTNCYAMRLAGTRMQHHWSRAGLTAPSKAGPVWTGEVRLIKQWLDQPRQWKRPRDIFVCAHSDLFHEAVPPDWLAWVLEVMQEANWHRYQVLTKRADRAHEALARYAAMPHVLLGFSSEDQRRYDERKQYMRSLAAAGWRIWCSGEPLLELINLGTDLSWLSWFVAGGESGPGARPMHPDWARGLRDQCATAGVPFFFKQWGAWDADALLFTDTEGRCPSPSMMVGKKRAGRLLDGRTHDEMPA